MEKEEKLCYNVTRLSLNLVNGSYAEQTKEHDSAGQRAGCSATMSNLSYR